MTWDAWLAWLLSYRAERQKLPLWLSLTWAEIITRLNYSQAMLLGALKVAGLKSWLQKVAQTGLCKGKLIQGEFTTCLQFRICSPVPSGGRVVPQIQPSRHGPKQHRSGEGPHATGTESPAHNGQACLKRGWVFFIVSNGTGRLNKTRTDSQNPAFETRLLEWIIFYTVLIQGSNGAVERRMVPHMSITHPLHLKLST